MNKDGDKSAFVIVIDANYGDERSKQFDTQEIVKNDIYIYIKKRKRIFL